MEIQSLPSLIDLKPDADEVEQQGPFGSCTANAGCSCLEIMYKRWGTSVNLSRMYLYYYSRFISEEETVDAGAHPLAACIALQTYGVCFEVTWPYIPENITTPPSASAIAEAEQFKILGYSSLTGDKLYKIRQALAHGFPVLLGMWIHASFRKLTGDWKTHDWDRTTSAENPDLGGHEVLIIGYDDTSQRLLIENSWGVEWGDGGFGGIPYDVVTTDRFGSTYILQPNYNITVGP